MLWVFWGPSAAPEAAAPVDVPLALVADYYEHLAEHAPPFQAGGVMQQRERYYQAPPDPFALLHSRLGSGSANDRALGAWLVRAEDRFLSGAAYPSDESKTVEDAAAKSSVDALTLLEVGRGFQFLMGDQLGAALFRAGLAKASMESKGVRPGDPSAQQLLHLLDQTKALYRVNDQAALAARFKLASHLYPPLSVDARRSACLCADALSVRGKAQEAADMILEAWRQDREVGDLGLTSSADVPEMDWRAGTYLSAAGRFVDATPFYADYVQTGSDDMRKRQAVVLWAICLDRQGKSDEAKMVRTKYPLPQRTAQSEPTTHPAVQ